MGKAREIQRAIQTRITELEAAIREVVAAWDAGAPRKKLGTPIEKLRKLVEP